MPPKAKGGKKEEKKPVEENEPDEEEKELMERELVINYLKSKLGKFQTKGEVLEEDNVKLAKELEMSRINLRDINEFLTNELKARSLTSAALEQKMMELEDEMQKMQEEFQEAADKLAADKDSEIERLNEEMEDLRKKKKQVEEYLEEKSTLEQQMADLQRALEENRQEHALEISNLERKHVQDKDRWKKEMAQKIKETKAQMMKLTDNQLEVTTKRTIMENEQMSSELAYQSRQTEKLLEKNRHLLDEATDLRRQVDLYKDMETELAKRNHVYQKTIKTLLEKLKLQGKQKRSDSELVDDLEGALEELQEKTKHAEMAVGEKVHEVAILTDALRKNQAHLAELDEKYDDTAKFLTACLTDVKRKIVTITRNENEQGRDQMELQPGKLEELGLEQREMALSYLLERLHVYQATARGGGAVGAGAPLFGSPQGTPGMGGFGVREGMGGVNLPPIVTPPQYQAQGQTLRGVVQPLEMAWPGRNPGSPGSPSQTRVSTSAQTQDDGGPGAEVLMGKLLTEVRPWGQKTKDTVITNKPKQPGYLRKGSGIHAGSVNSSVTYTQKFGLT